MTINYAKNTEALSSTLSRHAYIWRQDMCKTRSRIAAIASSAMKPRGIQLHCYKRVCTNAYSAWLSSSANTRVTERLHVGSRRSPYVSSMCSNNFMQQSHVKSSTTIHYRRVMMPKRMCPRPSAMTLSYFLLRLWGLSNTTSYHLS